ncbi:MAG: hypothetical protein ABIR62_09505 [Dokdonella sp.]
MPLPIRFVGKVIRTGARNITAGETARATEKDRNTKDPKKMKKGQAKALAKKDLASPFVILMFQSPAFTSALHSSAIHMPGESTE